MHPPQPGENPNKYDRRKAILEANRKRIVKAVEISFVTLILLGIAFFFAFTLPDKFLPVKTFRCKFEPSRVIQVGVIVDRKFVQKYTRDGARKKVEDVLVETSQVFLRQIGIEFRMQKMLFDDDPEWKHSDVTGDNSFIDCSKSLITENIANRLSKWVKERGTKFSRKVMTWILFKSEECWPENESSTAGKASKGTSDKNEDYATQYILLQDKADISKVLMHEMGHNLNVSHTFCSPKLPRNQITPTCCENGQNKEQCKADVDKTESDGYSHGIMDYFNGFVWEKKDGGQGRVAFHTVHEDEMCTTLKLLKAKDVWRGKNGKFVQGFAPEVLNDNEKILYGVGAGVFVICLLTLLVLIYACCQTYRLPQHVQKRPKKVKHYYDVRGDDDIEVNKNQQQVGTPLKKIVGSPLQQQGATPLQQQGATPLQQQVANPLQQVATPLRPASRMYKENAQELGLDEEQKHEEISRQAVMLARPTQALKEGLAQRSVAGSIQPKERLPQPEKAIPQLSPDKFMPWAHMRSGRSILPTEKPVLLPVKPVLPQETPALPSEKPALPREKPVRRQKPALPHDNQILLPMESVLPHDNLVLPPEKSVLLPEESVLPHDNPVLPDDNPILLPEKPVLPPETPVQRRTGKTTRRQKSNQPPMESVLLPEESVLPNHNPILPSEKPVRHRKTIRRQRSNLPPQKSAQQIQSPQVNKFKEWAMDQRRKIDANKELSKQSNSVISPTHLSKWSFQGVNPINSQNPRIALSEILERKTNSDKSEMKEDESEKKSEKSEKEDESEKKSEKSAKKSGKYEKKEEKSEKKSGKYETKEEKSEKNSDKYEKKEELEKNPTKWRNTIKEPEKYRRHRAETLAAPRGPPEISARKRLLDLTQSNSEATQVSSARERLLDLTKSESRNVIDPSGFGPKSSNSGQESVSSQDFNPKEPSLDSREASPEKKDNKGSREASPEKKDKKDSREASPEKKDKKDIRKTSPEEKDKKDAEEKRAKRTPMKGKGKGDGKGKGKGKGRTKVSQALPR